MTCTFFFQTHRYHAYFASSGFNTFSLCVFIVLHGRVLVFVSYFLHVYF